MQKIIDKLQEKLHDGRKPKVLTDCVDRPEDSAQCNDESENYDCVRKVFNLRFNHKPAYIILVENEAQVANAVKVAIDFNLPLRVCGGKHDHEGESSATGALVIDFKKMRCQTMISEGDDMLVSLEPGIRFEDFVQKMADTTNGKDGYIIPRGTCESVGVAGFSMGGGWGPWTRKYGMCCEYLVKARVVLGDGTIVTVSKDNHQELFWALRGGGGFSYGIVTKFFFKTMKAPKHAIKFKVVWENTPAIKVLKRWEQITNPHFEIPGICEKGNPKLVGTNLKIDGIPEDYRSIKKSIHECIFFGYYVGDSDTYEGMEEELNADLKKWFVGELYDAAKIDIPGKKNNQTIKFSSWERVAPKPKPQIEGMLRADFDADGDKPAPHKITSRLVKASKKGLGKKGRRNLIKSLRSPLISNAGKEMGIYTYVTLGAIWGNYYLNNPQECFPAGVAFPYRDRPYTIQYQCWWHVDNRAEANTLGLTDSSKENLYVNKALDWIAESRQRDFPQTNGSFISFKDSSVPTSQYFQQNYEKLQEIKDKYSEDKFNRFHSRKTIL